MMKRTFLLLALVASLNGCSGEPSAGAMEKAVERTVQETIAQSRDMIKQLAGPNAAAGLKDFTGFDSFEKLSCKLAEPPVSAPRSWTCQFRFSATLNDKSETSTQTANFYQTEKGWQADITGN